MKIAIMQPYFVPYPGYFLLFKDIDYFVVLDDVQHNPRGFIHRNKVEIYNNTTWLTLPLIKKRFIKISELDFSKNQESNEKYLNKIQFFFSNQNLDFLKKDLINLDQAPLHFINNIIKKIVKKLGFNVNFIFSSEISKNNLSGEKKIIDICKTLNADRYINLPGGKKLYNVKNFSNEGIKISFLDEYEGKKISILNYFYQNKNFLV